MKRVLALALTLASLGFAAPKAEAAESSSSPTTIISSNSQGPQFGREGRWDRGDRRYRHRSRVRVYTRYVRFGRRVYRETYLVRYLPFGGFQTRLISRERVR